MHMEQFSRMESTTGSTLGIFILIQERQIMIGLVSTIWGSVATSSLN